MKPQTISAFHAAQTHANRETCEALRRIIDHGLPEAESKIWHAHPVWFLGGNPIVGYSKLKDCVRLMFWSGQSFETSGLWPEGKFKAAGVRFTEAGQIDAPLLWVWLEKSRRIQWDYKNIVRRRGRLDRLT